MTDVAEPFPMCTNGMPKHAKVLEGVGLAHRSRRGREHVLRLNAVPLREVARWASRHER